MPVDTTFQGGPYPTYNTLTVTPARLLTPCHPDFGFDFSEAGIMPMVYGPRNPLEDQRHDDEQYSKGKVQAFRCPVVR
jgi:hypothetical protein